MFIYSTAHITLGQYLLPERFISHVQYEVLPKYASGFSLTGCNSCNLSFETPVNFIMHFLCIFFCIFLRFFLRCFCVFLHFFLHFFAFCLHFFCIPSCLVCGLRVPFCFPLRSPPPRPPPVGSLPPTPPLISNPSISNRPVFTASGHRVLAQLRDGFGR